MSNWLIYRTFWDLTISGIVLGLIYALVALGYTMVYGVLRLINFAHSEIFMVGTFGVLISLTNVFGISLFEDGEYPYRSGLVLVAILLCSTIAAMVVSGAGAVVLERTAYRPLRGAGDTYGAVVLAFLTGLIVSFLFSDQIMTNLAISAVVTGPVAYGYVRIFRRGRQAPRLAFLISAIGASMALAEAVATGHAILKAGGTSQDAVARTTTQNQITALNDARLRLKLANRANDGFFSVFFLRKISAHAHETRANFEHTRQAQSEHEKHIDYKRQKPRLLKLERPTDALAACSKYDQYGGECHKRHQNARRVSQAIHALLVCSGARILSEAKRLHRQHGKHTRH